MLTFLHKGDRATPSIPPSSPYQDGASAMDISPLPHKPPFSPNPADSSDPIEESSSIPAKPMDSSRFNRGQSIAHQ